MFLPFSKIIALLLRFRYWFLFPIAVLEGPIITIIAGFLSSLGYFNIFVVYIVVIIGDVLGDVVYYFLGRGGAGIVVRHGRYMGLTHERMQLVQSKFSENKIKTLLFGKWTQALGMPIIITAGILKMDVWEFVWVNTLGTIVKSGALLAAGYFFGNAYEKINQYINYTSYGVIIAVVVLALCYFALNAYLKNNFGKFIMQVYVRDMLTVL